MKRLRPKNVICERCDACFESKRDLQRHESRTKPCSSTNIATHGCPKCAKTFNRGDNLARHTKICGVRGGRGPSSNKKLEAEVEELREQLAALAASIQPRDDEKSPTFQIAPARPRINIGSIQQNIVIVVRPWDERNCIELTPAQIADAFRENRSMEEYAGLHYQSQLDEKLAPPYVGAMLAELTERAHANPAHRNVYLNPSRADQALVQTSPGMWQARNLDAVTRTLY